jgi:hypothetical protein
LDGDGLDIPRLTDVLVDVVWVVPTRIPLTGGMFSLS